MPGPFSAERDAPGWWRCRTCWGGTFRELPTVAEEAAAADRARVDVTTAVVADARGRVLHLSSVAQRRDRRRLTPALVRGMHEALLHRADPTRHRDTPAAAEWLAHVRSSSWCASTSSSPGMRIRSRSAATRSP